MDQLFSFFIGNTASHYVEMGFSDREAQAMAWISEQKPKGKFYGVLSGSFMALTWGHFHERIFSHLGIKCNRIYTQLAILGVFIILQRHSSLQAITYSVNHVMEPMSMLQTIST
jgi:hypothetical protein